MMQFEYKEITADGQIKTGTHQANNQNELVAIIKDRGSKPIDIKRIDEYSASRDIRKVDIGKISIGKQVSTKELAIFCRQLYTMLDAGMPLVSCIEATRDQANNKNLKQALNDVYSDLQKGEIFSVTLKKHPKIFPELMISMIASGELSGNLDFVISKLADQYQQDARIESQIKGAMIYPIILGFLMVGVIILLLVFLIPMFTEMFPQLEMPLPTKIVIGLSNFIRDRWYICLVLIGVIVFAYNSYKSTPSGKYNIDKSKLNRPITGNSVKMIVAARFASTLSTMISSGIPLIQAIEKSADVSNNAVLIKGLEEATDEIKKGSPMSTQFAKLNVFPPMMISMIKIGEESGAIDEMLEKTAEFYQEELEDAIKRLVSIIEPLMIVLMAVVIGFVVVSIYLPMFDMAVTGIS